MGKVLIGMDGTKSYRVYIGYITDLVEEARKIHQTTETATAALGRVLVTTAIESAMMKDDSNKVSIIFRGDGPAKQILSVGYGDGRIKAYIANPFVDIPLREDGKLDVGGALGIGELTVIKDLGLKKPYSGTIALVSGEIAEDMTAYYYISEQKNSSVCLGVKVGKNLSVEGAGGFLIQLMPGAEDDVVDQLEGILNSLDTITNIIEGAEKTDGEAEKASEEDILNRMMEKIFADIDSRYRPEVLEYKEVYLKCDCSLEKMESGLMAVGIKELSSIIEEDGQAEICCHFCNSKYEFDENQLMRLRCQLENKGNDFEEQEK